MLLRHPHLVRLAIMGVIACAGFVILPRSAACAETAMAIYRGEVPAATGPGRKIEMRLRADGTMSIISDYHNNRAPVTEDGRWNPISLQLIDVTVDRRDGVAISPTTLHFFKRGDVLQATPDSAGQFGGRSLQLRRTQTLAALPSFVPITGAENTTGSWKWEGMVSSSENLTVEHPERYTLEVQRGGKALVRADCNHGRAAYKSDGRSVAIRISGMTRSTCAPGSLSERYLKGLEAAVDERVRADALFLDLPGTGGTMRFVRAR